MSSSGSATRLCSRQTCTRDAVMTLTYVYSDSTAVVGPLAGHAEPHAYDLCGVHADRLTGPRGWRVVRLELPETRARREDIGAVAEAVREAEPPAPVRERPRTVLRDVSLPRPSVRQPSAQQPSAAQPSAPHLSAPHSSAPQPSARQPSAAQPSARHLSAPHPSAPGTDAPESSRTKAPESATRTRREPGPEVAWLDVPVPEALQRAHLRRPVARGASARPGV